MKKLLEFILENKDNYHIQDINVEDIIKRISKGDYKVIKDHLEEHDEIDDEFNILYVNGHNTSKNIYTNIEKNSPYQWIVLMNGNKEVAIQLLKFEEKDIIELIILERSNKAKDERNTFKKILDQIIDKYNPKEIHTFALNDKLKDKYKSYGFESDEKDQLTLKL